MRIEYISGVISFTGVIRPIDLDNLEAREKAKYRIEEKSTKRMEEERISVNPIYNSHGKIIKNIREKSLDILV
jgi:hypothetical protein